MRTAITRSEQDVDVMPERSQDTNEVGRATRSQDLAFAAKPPLFEDEPTWEAIETEEVEAEDASTVAALEAPGAGDDIERSAADGEGATADEREDDGDTDDAPAALASMPADAVGVGTRDTDGDRDGGADRDADDERDDTPVARAATAAGAATPGRHDAPHERRVRRATGHDARQDGYNRGSVRSNRVAQRRGRDGKLHANPHQIGRPGLRVRGKDEFHLRGDYAYRYQIVNGTKAVPVDKIWERDLQHGRETDGGRLALNPSAPRRLMIDGVGVWCVMSWSGGQSAAWIAIKDLQGKFADIKGKASQMSRRWNPKDAGRRKRDSAVEMKFRALGDPVATADTIDDGRYIVPGQKKKNGNEVGDYLVKDVLRRARPGTAGRAASESKRLERAHGDQPLAIEGGMRKLISIVGNLPHDKTPPVAIDVAQPGVDSFFVPRGRTFRREISLYKRTKTKSTLRQTWVFGYVGRDEGTRKVADKDRRGWVPLRTLTQP